MRSRLLLMILVPQTIGCGAGWRQPAALPEPLPDRQQVQMWSNGNPWQWHAVRVTQDSM